MQEVEAKQAQPVSQQLSPKHGNMQRISSAADAVSVRGQQQILRLFRVEALRVGEDAFHLVENDAFDDDW